MAYFYGTADSLQARLKGPYGSLAIRAVELTLSAEGWKGAVSPYSQAVTLPGITERALVELQPAAALLEQLRQSGIGLAAENDEGLVTVYAFGAKPTQDIAMQATIMEVQR